MRMSSGSYPRHRRQPIGRGDPDGHNHNHNNNNNDRNNNNNNNSDSDNDSDNHNHNNNDRNNSNSDNDSDNHDNNSDIPDASQIRKAINKLPRDNPVRKSYAALLNCNKWPGTCIYLFIYLLSVIWHEQLFPRTKTRG